MDDEDTEEQEGLVAGSYQVSAVACECRRFVLCVGSIDDGWQVAAGRVEAQHVRARAGVLRCVVGMAAQRREAR